MQIDDRFDSGNIEVIDASDPADIRLTIRPDPPSETAKGVVRYRQWFHFRLAGVRDVPLTIHLEDVAAWSYPKGWEGYRAVCSSDHRHWGRADTAYEDGHLTIRVTPDADVLWLAYFAPYALERLRRRIGEWCRHADVWLRPLCRTVEGRPLDRLIIGRPARDVPVVWVVARQHPGETMASWWMEGFVRRLLDDHDGLARRLRERATFHVVPLMNPDGSHHGFIRTNARGVDLNRAWEEPPMDDAPEVHATLAAMDRTGVDLCLDVHGESDIPHSFVTGPHGVEAWGARLESQERAFCDAYERANPDFQQVAGYPRDRPGRVTMGILKNAITQRFGCYATTLEMPFKHSTDVDDETPGWNPERCQRMGASALSAFDAALDALARG
ncbi:MAG TPA: M14-type cytosolic carboxypeptidase [Sandaracinaceae bacterium LLY-WYZ-13_1]|nr:M14-type cytosolic carboxypeptidase [Sandaracinaceae bacterium LLY-WYZ-13_1]